MSNEQQTVRVHVAGYVDLCVGAGSDLVVLTTETARDIEYELTERWRPQEDESSCLADHVDEQPLVTVKPLFALDQSVAERLSVLTAKVKEWTAVDVEWVDVRDRYRDEHGDETDPEALDKLITSEFFQKFWEVSEEMKSAAALLLSALPPLPQSAN
jgi:hypothetical protein